MFYEHILFFDAFYAKNNDKPAKFKVLVRLNDGVLVRFETFNVASTMCLLQNNN